MKSPIAADAVLTSVKHRQPSHRTLFPPVKNKLMTLLQTDLAVLRILGRHHAGIGTGVAAVSRFEI
jgi:hypothetical protein